MFNMLVSYTELGKPIGRTSCVVDREGGGGLLYITPIQSPNVKHPLTPDLYIGGTENINQSIDPLINRSSFPIVYLKLH